LGDDTRQPRDSIRFFATIRQQIYSGASELLELQTANGAILRARIPCAGPLSGSYSFIFCADDAIPVRE